MENTISYIVVIALMSITLLNSSCNKQAVYEVETIHLKANQPLKPNVKSTSQFIAISFSDIFNHSIKPKSLDALQEAYESFGDKKLVESLIVKNFMNQGGYEMPLKSEMYERPEAFVKEAYMRFFNRPANEFELLELVNLINADTNDILSPGLIYLAMMSSNEYRAY